MTRNSVLLKSRIPSFIKLYKKINNQSYVSESRKHEKFQTDFGNHG